MNTVTDGAATSGLASALIDEANPQISGYAGPIVDEKDLLISQPLSDETGSADDVKIRCMEEFIQGVSGMPITTPVLGRISLGSTYRTDAGRILPKKEDHFNITSLVKNQDHSWVPHPIQSKLIERQGKENKVLRIIPIKLMYDSVDLNLQDSYSCFNKLGRMVCTGNGLTAKRVGEDGLVKRFSCPGSTFCSFGRDNLCKPYGRFYAQIEGQNDLFGAFVLRTTGYNSINNIRYKLTTIKTTFGYLSHIPLSLVIRAKSSAQSFWTPFYFADIIVAETTTELIEKKKATDETRKMIQEAGLNFSHSDEVSRFMIKRGALFENGEDEQSVFEEFFSFEGSTEADSVGRTPGAASGGNDTSGSGNSKNKKEKKPKSGTDRFDAATSDNTKTTK